MGPNSHHATPSTPALPHREGWMGSEWGRQRHSSRSNSELCLGKSNLGSGCQQEASEPLEFMLVLRSPAAHRTEVHGLSRSSTSCPPHSRSFARSTPAIAVHAGPAHCLGGPHGLSLCGATSQWGSRCSMASPGPQSTLPPAREPRPVGTGGQRRPSVLRAGGAAAPGGPRCPSQQTSLPSGDLALRVAVPDHPAAVLTTVHRNRWKPLLGLCGTCSSGLRRSRSSTYFLTFIKHLRSSFTK
ncbi:uncharacterized protein LOC134477429 [Cavia porcellus]|uniref:uncharacterized protein LOC134477429 n=1 Tax=Cavia porcellus TaxID=10141 RepID=UPI002FE1F082